MKISNIVIQKYNHNQFNYCKNQKSPFKNKNKDNCYKNSINFSGEYYRSLLNINNKNINCLDNDDKNNIAFGNLYHKTISSKVPVYRPCCSTYDDIDEFSRQFCEKINSQIQNPSIEDVERLIENVKKETGADERLVKEVVFRLSQFSSFDSLKYIDEILENNNEKLTDSSKPCLTNAFLYFGEKFNFFSNTDGTPVSFIDDFYINYTEDFSDLNINNSIMDALLKNCVNKSYILDGFDVLTSEGKYCGANFMAGTGYLEALSIDVIKQIQNGKDIEDIMHKDLEKRYRKKLKEDIYEKHNIEIIKKKIPDNITAEDILENLKENELDSTTIKNTIESFTKKCLYTSQMNEKPDNSSKKSIKELLSVLKTGLMNKTDVIAKKDIEAVLMKYLDNFAIVFSAHSISKALNEIQYKIKELEEKTGRKNILCVNYPYKSNSALTYMLMKNNEIDCSKVSNSPFERENPNFNYIFVDDVTLSGHSQFAVVKNEKPKKNLFFIYLVGTKFALDYLKQKKFKNTVVYKNAKDIVKTEIAAFEDYIDNKKNKSQSNLTYEDMQKLNLVLRKNYKACGTAVGFPYILPDNNSDFASEILTPLLTRVTYNSKKS